MLSSLSLPAEAGRIRRRVTRLANDQGFQDQNWCVASATDIGDLFEVTFEAPPVGAVTLTVSTELPDVVFDNLMVIKRSVLDDGGRSFLHDSGCFSACADICPYLPFPADSGQCIGGCFMNTRDERSRVPTFELSPGGGLRDPQTLQPLPPDLFPFAELFGSPLFGNDAELRDALVARGWTFAGAQPTYGATAPDISATERVLLGDDASVADSGATTGLLVLSGQLALGVPEARITVEGLEPGELYSVLSWFKQDEQNFDTVIDIFSGPADIALSGPAARVNLDLGDDQLRPDVAADTSGRTAVVWDTPQSDSPCRSVRGRTIDSSGALAAAEAEISDPSTCLSASSLDARVAIHPESGLYVASWLKSSLTGAGIYGRRLDFDTGPLGAPFVVEDPICFIPPCSSIEPAATSFADTGFTISWLDLAGDGSPNRLFVGSYLDDGTSSGVFNVAESLFLLSGVTDGLRGLYAAGGALDTREFELDGTLKNIAQVSAMGNPRDPDLAVDEVDQELLVWVADDAFGSSIYARLTLGPTGQGGAIRLSGNTVAARASPSVGSDGDSFVVAWEEAGDLFARLVDGGGQPRGGVLAIAPIGLAQSSPAVAGGPVGRFVVAYEQATLGADTDIWVQQIVALDGDLPLRILTISRGGSGSGVITTSAGPEIDCGDQCSASLPLGSQVQLQATPDPGSFFVGWGGACNPDILRPRCEVNLLGNETAIAIFEPGQSIDLSGAPPVVTNGSATWDGNLISLTFESPSLLGSAWLDTQQDLSQGFETLFTFHLSHEGGVPGEGMAFVVQDDPAGSAALGGGGPGIGYATSGAGLGIARSVALEFDTNFSPIVGDTEIDGNHLSVQTRGTVANGWEPPFSLGRVTPGFSLSNDTLTPGDGDLHGARVRYFPGSYSVFLDELDSPLLSVPLDLANVFGSSLLDPSGRSWVGFTAATGPVADQQSDILSWSFWVPTLDGLPACRDRLEASLADWASAPGPGGSISPWEVVSSTTHSPSTAFFVSNFGTVQDELLVLSTAIPVGASTLLSFWHLFDTEPGYDGGVLEISTDGGTTFFDILEGNGAGVPANPSRLLRGDYTETLSTCCSNPLPGRQAWSGQSAGWEQVLVDLSDFAALDVQLRWRFGADSLLSKVGWWVDDIALEGVSPCPLGAAIFADGFESGNVSAWRLSHPP